MDLQKIISNLKKRPALTGASFLIFLILVFVGWRYDQIDIYKAQLFGLQDTLAKLQRNTVNSAQLGRQLDALKKINGIIESAALRPADLARNAQYFYTLEADNNVKLLELQQQTVAAPPRGAAQPLNVPLNFNVNLAGDYDQLLKFMREIETAFLGGKIISATISPGAAIAGKDPAKARLLSMVVQTIARTK